MLQLGVGLEADTKLLAGGVSDMSDMLCDLSGSRGCDVGLLDELASTPSQKCWSLRLCKQAGDVRKSCRKVAHPGVCDNQQSLARQGVESVSVTIGETVQAARMVESLKSCSNHSVIYG